MDFELDDTQEAIVSSVRTLAARHAGAERARELGLASYDDTLADALRTAGFLDLATSDHAGPLAAALVIEEIARAAGCIDVGSLALVAPLVLGEDRPARVALLNGREPHPARYAPGSDAFLVLADDGVDLYGAADVDIEAVESVYGYPFGRVALRGAATRSLDQGTRQALVDAWRIALAAETAGLLSAALQHTIDHLKEREQFGRPLAALQAVQHRLAEAHIWVEGVGWLARAAAYHWGDSESAACAATYACSAIRAVAADLQQLSGAIGFTTEFDLHVWTTRLWALRVELDGAERHAADLSAARWSTLVSTTTTGS